MIRKQQGRKALIVLSDGVDVGSKESLETAIMTAQRADTVVYSILFGNPEQNQFPTVFGIPGGSQRGGSKNPEQQKPLSGKKILERISSETGGRLFEVSKKQSIGEIYKTIAEELRNQYNIGYSSNRADAGAGYRKIHLVTRQKDLLVQTRDGYYAGR